MTETFPIIPAGRGTALTVGSLLLVVSLPVLVMAFASGVPWPARLISTLVALVVGGLVVYAGYSSRNVVFEVSPEGLRVRNSIYGRLIPRDQILPAGGRIVDMRQERDLRPVFRTFGTGLPGYGEGWFRLANREKALLFFTSSPRAVYLPTRQGYFLLLSVAHPEEFLALARRLWI